MSKIQYSDLQIYLRKIQRSTLSSAQNETQQKESATDQRRRKLTSQERPLSQMTQNQPHSFFPNKRASLQSPISQSLQLDTGTQKLDRIPNTKETFTTFYKLKQSEKKPMTQALATFTKEPITCHEIMESREGCTALQSKADGRIYIYGGRNIKPLNKLETLDCGSMLFKRVEGSLQEQMVGRFNHSMVEYRNEFIFYGGQTGSTYSISKSQTLKDMISFDVQSQQWKIRPQSKLQSYCRRNHSAFVLNHFMVIHGGINEFNQHLEDTIIYDLHRDSWIKDLNILGSPNLSHSQGCPVFYDQRHFENQKQIYPLHTIDWGICSSFLKEEGFYLFGGMLYDGQASSALWILRIENHSLEWVKADRLTKGSTPSPRYSHSMTSFKKENALVVCGGRDDQRKVILNDIHLLALDSLAWTEVKVYGQGGIEEQFKLSNKVTFLTFDQSKIMNYSKAQIARRGSSINSLAVKLLTGLLRKNIAEYDASNKQSPQARLRAKRSQDTKNQKLKFSIKEEHQQK